MKCELFELEDELGTIAGDGIESLTQDIDDEMVDFGYITSLQMVSAGSTATLGVSTVTGYVRKIVLTNDGFGYTQTPTVAITTAPAGGTDATAVAITTSVGNVFSIKEILLINQCWIYYTPTVSIVSAASTIAGIGSTTFELVCCNIDTCHRFCGHIYGINSDVGSETQDSNCDSQLQHQELELQQELSKLMLQEMNFQESLSEMQESVIPLEQRVQQYPHLH